MKAQSTRHLGKICLVLFAVALAGFAMACKSREAEPMEKAQPAAQMEAAGAAEQMAGLRSILGEAKEDYPGVQDIEQEGKDLIIYYRFIPQDTNTLQEELGEDLGPKIRKIYETDKAANVLRFDVSVPFTEETGTTGFKRQLTFTMTRKIFEETDWSGLLDRDFLKVVQDLKAEG